MDDSTAAGSVLHSTKADAETAEELFRLLLGRPLPGEMVKAKADKAFSIAEWIRVIVDSNDFKQIFLNRVGAVTPSSDFIADAEYRTPRLGPAPLPRRVLVAGSCVAVVWRDLISRRHPDVALRHVLTNNASELEDIALDELRQFDFQLAQVALRAIVGDAEIMQWRGPAQTDGANEALLALATTRLREQFDSLMKYKRQTHLPVFFSNFVVPQANPLGALLPRYDLSNIVYFVERLNQALAGLIAAESGVYLLDYDAICASLGKRYILDDITSHINHNSFIGPSFWSNDLDLTPHGEVGDLYKPKWDEAALALFNSALSLFEIVSPTAKIKIVIFDLDGTLWRGVAAEADDIDAAALSEGWPLGVVEAAAFLKTRGILLAIASKNDPEAVRDIWDKVYGRKFALENFVCVKAGWDDKVRSVAEILHETNLLPESALFVDDNPREREQIRAAFPDMSILEGPILNWRRALLWSAELQTPAITAESASRTESVRTMAQREAARAQIDPADYLRSLDVQVHFDAIASPGDKKFARACELLNKTNQFNTTGRRWSEPELTDWFAAGGRIHAATVSDRLSDYGLTALLLARAGACEQMVMSCRVFGMQVEHRLIDHFLRHRGAEGAPTIAFRPTGKNGPSATFLKSLGVPVAQASGEQIEFFPLAAPPASA